MHLWTTTAVNDYKNLNHQQSGSSSNSSSPTSNNQEESHKYHPLNLSISTNNNNLMCTE
jgi:hypothetical protein